MAAQAKSLHRLCHSLWRVNVPGVCGHRSVLGGSTSCQLHLRPSSSSSHHSLTSSTPPSTPTCFFPIENFKDICHTNVKNANQTVLNNQAHRKPTNDVFDVCSTFSGLSLSNSDLKLPKRELNLASWPNQQHTEYVCPSEKLSTLPELVILEQQLNNAVSYDLPQTPNIISQIIDPVSTSKEISEPTNTTTNAPVEARQIMKIRRKKMKRHLLKKFRKRMVFTLRKMKRERRRKKEALFQARLASIKSAGDSFSAQDWVQEHLDKARKGGFYINILEKR